MILSKQDKVYLLDLSRKALEYIFKTGTELEVDEKKIPKKFKEKAATFVTLTKKGQLRGCIGKIMPTKELYRDILEHTYGAAFGDPRFKQLTKDELDQVKIEISILSLPKELEYLNEQELVKKLEKTRPGVVLQKGVFHTATFLPQVWEDLPKAKDLLSQLCLKAGLDKDAWLKQKLTIQTYTVEKFSE